MDDIELQAEIEALKSQNQSDDLLDDNLLPTKSEKEKPKKKDEGIFGVLIFQTIIAVSIAIFYVLCSTFIRAETDLITQKLKQKLVTDFSFQQTVYTAVGNIFTYLNTIAPVDVNTTSSGDTTSSQATDNSSVPSESGDQTSSNTVSSENQPSSEPSSETTNEPSSELDGAGGTFQETDGVIMPTNATFAPVIYTGSILYPLKIGGLTSEFGFRINPINNKPDFHNALDIASPKDTPVRAVADGVIIKSEFDASLGNFIRIQHSGGFVTTYGHCDRLIAKVGVKIKEGEIIARVGSTGDSTGPHLHFATSVNGIYFDPSYLYDTKLGLT